ncbi:MAG: hypothetical protein LBN74_07850 [Prevotella sp.]|jgi:hypothetical protein|nr:hypothetical protein [Prevotella sp.]
MGYFIKGLEIARETATPAKVSLAGNPNYIEFASKTTEGNKRAEVTIEVIDKGFIYNLTDQQLENFTKFTIVESKSGESHVFEATTNINNIGGGVYYVGPASPAAGPGWSLNKIAEALKNALQRNSFIGNKFDIYYPPVADDEGNISCGTVIKLRAKGRGNDYAFEMLAADDWLYEKYIEVTWSDGDADDSDSICEGYNPVEIQLELYKGTGVFLGEDDSPIENMGSPIMTLTKAYTNTPVWFNVNILEKNKIPSGFLDREGWTDTGTINDFRFAAKRLIADKNYYDDSLFYYSPVLYTVAGYKRALEENNLSEYVFDTQEIGKAPEDMKRVKPLTNQPAFFHIKGQTQYFNFILSDAEHHANLNKEYELGIVFKLYTQSGRFIAAEQDHFMPRTRFYMINTVKLNINKVMEKYPNAGKVEAFLACRYAKSDPVEISEQLVFNILPECLHRVKDFAFLNRLGGWSSFNFPGTAQTEFKTNANTIFKTHTPDHIRKIDGKEERELESVYSKSVTEQFSVQTMPVAKEVCDWLKELSASKAVYELSTNRYVIVDEMNINPNSKDELFRLEMKYHYSDSYNNVN